MERRDPFEEAEVDAAADEARHIGGVAGDEDLPPAERPVREAGGGEAEGFEQAEDELIEHASHGDEHSARMAIYDAIPDDEPGAEAEFGEADAVHSSEIDPDDPEDSWTRQDPGERSP
jgi:hypothetical protein